MNWYIEVLKKYFKFGGRARRKEYWYFALFNIIFTIVFIVIDGVAGTFDPEAGIGMFGLVYMLAVLIPGIAVSFRRLHDTGRSAWWFLIALIPLIGMLVILVFMMLNSEEGENRFGANPKSELA